MVRDRRPPGSGSTRDAMRAATARLRVALRELPQRPALRWFLLGNFCLVDVLNTAVLYFADFTVEVFREQAAAGQLQVLGYTFPPADLKLLGFVKVTGLSLNALALVFGVLLGAHTDRAPLGVMRWSGVALLGALVGGTVFGGHSALGYLVTLVMLGAFGLSGILTAGRQMVLRLAPKERIGEFFGLYGITTKLSVIGGVVYGQVSAAYGCKPAMLAQSLQLLLGMLCLAMVRMPRTPNPATS